MAAFPEIDGLQDEDVHRELDLTPGVSRGELEVGDDRVARVGGVELAVGRAAQFVVLPDASVCAERPSFECRRLGSGRIDHDARDLRFSGGHGEKDGDGQVGRDAQVTLASPIPAHE